VKRKHIAGKENALRSHFVCKVSGLWDFCPQIK
jgi:hypothetical protein